AGNVARPFADRGAEEMHVRRRGAQFQSPAQILSRLGILLQALASEGTVLVRFGEIRTEDDDLVQIGRSLLVALLPQMRQTPIQVGPRRLRRERQAGVVTGQRLRSLR